MINVLRRMGRANAILCTATIVLALITNVPSSYATTYATEIRLKMADFFRLDSEHAWALVYNRSNKAFLFQTSDGGANWTAFSTPFVLQHLFFIDSNIGWGIAQETDGQTFQTFCVRTSDSGRTWSRIGSLDNRNGKATGIAFDTDIHGWIVGESYMGTAFVYETTDAGEHWHKLDWNGEPASGLYGVSLYAGTAFTWSAGAGGSGIFELRSGARPKRFSDLETINLFISGNSTLSASQSAVYQRTSTNGEWHQVLEAVKETFWDMKFVDQNHGCVVGGEVYCTSDGGKTWEARGVPHTAKGDHDYAYRLYLLDAQHGWADGNDSIYETTDGAKSWSNVDFFSDDDKPLTHTRRIDDDK
jgi:photosystem II stability/assembly factor-like uncharacterized protein